MTFERIFNLRRSLGPHSVNKFGFLSTFPPLLGSVQPHININAQSATHYLNLHVSLRHFYNIYKKNLMRLFLSIVLAPAWSRISDYQYEEEPTEPLTTVSTTTEIPPTARDI